MRLRNATILSVSQSDVYQRLAKEENQKIRQKIATHTYCELKVEKSMAEIVREWISQKLTKLFATDR
jgi:hypothetical protein